MIMTQLQSITRLEAQIDQLAESSMKRELSQLLSQPIPNFKNNTSTHQPPKSSHQSNIPPKNPQFENDKAISELRSDRILKDPYQDQVTEASTDTSQNIDLKEEFSTETNHIEESKFETSTDASSNLSEKDKDKKRADELSEIYKPRVSFLSSPKVSSFSLKSPPPSELKSPLVKPEYACLESNDTFPAPIVLNSTPNLKTQFMSILEEQIGEIFDK